MFGEFMSHDVITRLLPVLGISGEARFNVFDVMHHGTHEKQLSNVFAWLLDPDGTHCLGDNSRRSSSTWSTKKGRRSLRRLGNSVTVRTSCARKSMSR